MPDVPQRNGELILIRHAPIADPTLLCGRTDIDAQIDPAITHQVASNFASLDRIVASPARRCIQTAQALFPDHAIAQDERLWEQDFGQQDGKVFADLPDLGPLSNEDLALHQPPDGESFRDMCHRAWPALTEYAQTAHGTQAPTILVVHAGIIRAAISLALDHMPAGLGFEISNLSINRFGVSPTGLVSVRQVNRV